jgi:thiosulfate/3-mercaptopyruvate sulfurtransferase
LADRGLESIKLLSAYHIGYHIDINSGVLVLGYATKSEEHIFDQMSSYQTLISADELVTHLDDPDWVIIDARFALAQPDLTRQEYLQAHIPGAVFASLNEDLSGAVLPGVTGRHPLPAPEVAAGFFGRCGIGPGIQVVIYDDQGGALAAARAWWMLRWLGHEAAAVLDGGWQYWQQSRYPIRSGEERRPRREFILRLRPEMAVDADQVEALRLDPAYKLFDGRSAERYHGVNETIDPVAGHIPGAISAPYSENLGADGLFRSPEALRGRFLALLGETPAHKSVFYCGSGVTAAHDILAMEVAGLGESRLYAGSWSEWITNLKRPIARD